MTRTARSPVLETLIDAQKEYASTTHDDETVKHYASRVFGAEGKQDGLYWETADNLTAESHRAASCRGVGRRLYPEGGRAVTVGYIFRLLTRQGPAARGSARDYR